MYPCYVCYVHAYACHVCILPSIPSILIYVCSHSEAIYRADPHRAAIHRAAIHRAATHRTPLGFLFGRDPNCMQQPSQENTAGAAEHAWNIYCAWHSRAAEEQTRDRQNDIWKAFMRRVVIEWARLIDVLPARGSCNWHPWPSDAFNVWTYRLPCQTLDPLAATKVAECGSAACSLPTQA